MNRKKFVKKPHITFASRNSNFHRVIHADGVTVQFGVHGGVRLIFFNQRPSDPSQFSCELTEGGMIGHEIPETVVSKSQWIREIEIDVAIAPETAASLMAVLQTNLKIIPITPNEGSDNIQNEGET